ncbi:MAG: hypothetical protein LUE29_10160 [Lachnospiraceae bacterium]|nr:hypothetical protein [Lachnospiraceae bacterium]
MDSEKQVRCGNTKSVLAILFGILIASCGFLLPLIFFAKEDEVLIGSQSTVNVLSSDSVHTVTRDSSFTLEDYAYITRMTQSGSRYYSEPAETQISMREAANAAGEILKTLLPEVFTGDVKQSYTLSSAILTSNIQSSEEEYDYRQSFWYVDISYPDYINDLTVSSAINAVNGRAWAVEAFFPLDSTGYDSYGIRVVDHIMDTWGIDGNLFCRENLSAVGVNLAEFVPTNAEKMNTEAVEGEFYAEYVADEAVLVHNASVYFERLETAVRNLDGLANFMTNLYENYMSYLGILTEENEAYFSVEILFDEDLWYNTALQDCRDLISIKEEQYDAARGNYVFAQMYDSDSGGVDTILLDSDTYEETLLLMSLTEEVYTLDVTLLAAEETTGLTVTVSLMIICDEEFVITISLGAGH